MRVKLIVTGSMERAALHRSLQRYFPVTGDGVAIEFLRPTLVDGLTSNELPALDDQLPEFVRTFAYALVAETLEGSEPRTKPPDLVVGIDDLELANAEHPQRVTAWLRAAVADYFTCYPAGIDSHRRWHAALRSRCCFHLLAPMPEAYFFGERAALTRAGVTSEVEAHLACEDLEAFETNDPALTTRHPKRYLEHLLRRSGRPEARPYRETRDGVRALERLAWPELSNDAQTLALARALFEDLAEAFDVPNPLGEGALAPATHPHDRRALLLRNI